MCVRDVKHSWTASLRINDEIKQAIRTQCEEADHSPTVTLVREKHYGSSEAVGEERRHPSGRELVLPGMARSFTVTLMMSLARCWRACQTCFTRHGRSKSQPLNLSSLTASHSTLLPKDQSSAAEALNWNYTHRLAVIGRATQFKDSNKSGCAI